MSENYHLETMLIHAENFPEKNRQTTTLPIYQSTSFKYKSCEEISRVYKGESPGFIYTRVSNPSLEILERRLSALEEGLGAIVTSSGMFAITAVLLTLAKSGQHIVSSNSLFGGTYALLNKTLKGLGINFTFVDPIDPSQFEKAIKEETKAIFIETLGNPKLDIPDLSAIAKIAEKYQIPFVVDSTITTPVLLQPKKLGVNIVIHSTSKFINGHGNSIGGALIDCGNFDWTALPHFKEYNEKYGALAFLAKTRREVYRDFGGVLSPFNAFLMSLGLETLSLRMEKHCSNAASLSDFLDSHPKVKAVNYPGLKGGKFYEIAGRQFKNRFGSLLTFRLENQEQCFKMIDSLKLAYNLANLGDAKTLVIHPASTICVEFNKEEREKMGVYDDLIRISAGLEHPQDIISDFKQALEKI